VCKEMWCGFRGEELDEETRNIVNLLVNLVVPGVGTVI